MRFAALSIVVVACLVAPGRAAAHSRSPTVALDYRLELSRAALPGVHAQVVDGDRSLRVRVDPPHRLLVLGLLGEPFLRFGPERRVGQPRLAECGRGQARAPRHGLGAADGRSPACSGTTTGCPRPHRCVRARAPLVAAARRSTAGAPS